MVMVDTNKLMKIDRDNRRQEYVNETETSRDMNKLESPFQIKQKVSTWFTREEQTNPELHCPKPFP
jgi:hypothetical protein